MKGHISIILQICIDEFSDNEYVINYNKRNLAAIENPKVVHEEYDQNLSLGMPMHPIEESNIAPPNIPASSTTKIINDKKEYDDALDDGPILPKNSPCLEMSTNLYEDKNDQLAICDNTHTHMNPTLFLKSPNHTIEEKLVYVKKYLSGLQLSLDPNLCCSHNIKSDTNPSNYFERGKNESHIKFNDPLYVPILSKLHNPNSYIVKFAPSNCNYYERGGDKCPPYAGNNMNSSTGNMQGCASNCYNSIIYKMQCIGRKLELKSIGFMHHGLFYQALNYLKF